MVHYIFNEEQKYLLELWDKHSFEYRIILDEYYFYLRIKKELGIRPVNRLSKDELGAFPDIEFLNQYRRVDAEDYLYGLNPDEVQRITKQIIDEYVENGLTENLRTRIQDYIKQIEQKECSHSRFASNPDSCSNGHHTHQYKALLSSRF